MPLFVYPLWSNGSPFTFLFGTLYPFKSKLSRNDRFHYSLIYFNQRNSYLFIYLKLRKVPLSGEAFPYRILKGVPHGEKVLFYILSRRYAEKTRRRTTLPNFVGGEGAAVHRLRSTITWGCIIHFSNVPGLYKNA